MKVKAILWDGFNKINGELFLDQQKLSFHLSDFANTDLEFDLPYSEIVSVDHHHLFGLSEKALEITTKAGKSNVFVVEKAKRVRWEIETIINKI